ncbi:MULTISPECIES: FKBP-type peptidyl-prolyl cis-trans isomerase [unclassified Tenacibaculum]|uniref:FKBP-type peptidyl-prolyl cis-trans isomerase n=1 Tax=unclassified Tenacibaculum TaxID=2635139 RepID=UPI001F3E888A|nr:MULTISPECIES: FKBP-type peptidyl-prolyl cis-trans isomerase [unclassified Tenacibaculum]MCF2874138.1 FKBP-type peptidyl-prolyl cis-trans isomerase [Tenacibaculum sp. Cn5-1]MCF2934719.1 FKBP-type peptidyl-prolyl cis-trans isomerase [Tenacibaculum sp. Cn5-34]MCG7510929.1 FKBP-type peptidyl-prolyl cis-trans isomerase [Tenacibaculum sp. Cn5-46]
MKLTNILAATVIGLSIVSCNNTNNSNGQFKPSTSLDSELDSVSYAIGLDMANKIKSNFEEMNQDLFMQGFKNGMDSTSLLLETKDLNLILRTFFQKQQLEKMKKQQEEQARKAEKEFGEYKKEGEKFIAENKTKEGVKTTDSGLQYIVLKEGKGEAPKATSRVKVHYHGTLSDGTVFDSSVDRGQPSEFGVSQVIKGWTEGLQLMKPGAKYKFFIPQELAYGAQQRGAKIKPFSPLVFEVELLEVK